MACIATARTLKCRFSPSRAQPCDSLASGTVKVAGVPGRSRVCVACLKRKKRCGLEKPFCGTCRKARVECGGYYRPSIFINNTIETQNQQLVKGKAIAMVTPAAMLPYHLSLLAPPTTPDTWTSLGKWIGAIHDLRSSERKYRYLKEEGRRLYTGLMKSLAAALRDTKRANSDAILTAVRLSNFYEFCFGQNDGEVKQVRSWQAHNAGHIALISAHSFISGHTHDLFADGRSNVIMSYLRQRKRCFLADPDWRTMPWLQREKKNARDHLMDILLDLTGLFEDLDNMKSIPDPNLF
ncbi:hypothetical protein BDW68DRAFT_175624 [Aspergillus falconensis]